MEHYANCVTQTIATYKVYYERSFRQVIKLKFLSFMENAFVYRPGH